MTKRQGKSGTDVKALLREDKEFLRALVLQEMLGVTALIYGQRMGEAVALVTDGRFSGATPRCQGAAKHKRR